MGRLRGVFIILAAACAAAGCFSPAGSISGATDRLTAVPSRIEYSLGDSFVPEGDLEVRAAYQGEEKTVPLSQVKISIAEPPYRPNELKDVPFDTGCVLDKTGAHVVVVGYAGLSTSYSIEVLDPADKTGQGSGTSPGIHIEWAD